MSAPRWPLDRRRLAFLLEGRERTADAAGKAGCVQSQVWLSVRQHSEPRVPYATHFGLPGAAVEAEVEHLQTLVRGELGVAADKSKSDAPPGAIQILRAACQDRKLICASLPATNWQGADAHAVLHADIRG